MICLLGKCTTGVTKERSTPTFHVGTSNNIISDASAINKAGIVTSIGFKSETIKVDDISETCLPDSSMPAITVSKRTDPYDSTDIMNRNNVDNVTIERPTQGL